MNAKSALAGILLPAVLLPVCASALAAKPENGTVISLRGGTLIAIGSASMPVAPSTSSPQGWLMAATSGQAGSVVTVLSGGTVVAEFTAPVAFGNVVYSSSAIKSGSAYTVSVNGTAMNVTAGVASAGGMGPRR